MVAAKKEEEKEEVEKRFLEAVFPRYRGFSSHRPASFCVVARIAGIFNADLTSK